MILSRKIFFLFISVVLFAVLGGCTGNSQPTSRALETGESPDNNLLRVGLTPDYPPVVYIENKRVTGLEIEYARALAAELGKKLLVVPLKFADLIPALQRHDIDIIMSGLSITKLRSVRVAFTDPYLSVGQMVLVRSEDRVKYGVPQMIIITNDRIGVVKGTTGDIFVRNNCANAEKIDYESVNNAVLDLQGGSIDMLIFDAPQIWMLAAENETNGLSMLPFQLTKEYLAWAVNKEDQRFLAEINNILEKWRKNGTMRNVSKRWLPFYNM
jgi:polar amino acid transport system substrate-binding protein